jgi:hypothetical protein
MSLVSILISWFVAGAIFPCALTHQDFKSGKDFSVTDLLIILLCSLFGYLTFIVFLVVLLCLLDVDLDEIILIKARKK